MMVVPLAVATGLVGAGATVVPEVSVECVPFTRAVDRGHKVVVRSPCR